MSRPVVVVVRTDPRAWTDAGAWWEVGVPSVTDRAEVVSAREELEAGKRGQVRYLG